jgi:hypothetical protein
MKNAMTDTLLEYRIVGPLISVVVRRYTYLRTTAKTCRYRWSRHRKGLEATNFSVFVHKSINFSAFVLTVGASDDSMWIRGLVLLFLLVRSLPISHELYRF